MVFVSILLLLWLLLEVVVVLGSLSEELIFLNSSVTLVVYDQERKMLHPCNILGEEKVSTGTPQTPLRKCSGWGFPLLFQSSSQGLDP